MHRCNVSRVVRGHGAPHSLGPGPHPGSSHLEVGVVREDGAAPAREGARR